MKKNLVYSKPTLLQVTSLCNSYFCSRN